MTQDLADTSIAGEPAQADRLAWYKRMNVRTAGSGERKMMFAHGFGCDQEMWRLVAPAFEQDFETVLFDYVGAGASDLTAYDAAKYSSLEGYSDDVIDLARACGMKDAVFVGHSVSAMIGLIAARRAPELFSSLVLVVPSPCYINDGDYLGGFDPAEIDELLALLDSNHLGWAQEMAPIIMGNGDRPELGQELADSFCRIDPEIAQRFARVTFLTDSRADIGALDARVLILHCREDAIAPPSVITYVHRAIPGSQLVMLDATGHCPHLSAPEATIAAIKAFV